MSVRDEIAGYIEGITHETGLEHSINLFESGLLTSLDVLSLVSFIEDTFKIDISGDDIDMESFGTINGIVDLIETKQHQAQAGKTEASNAVSA
jgi:methoxymalonate biosynthesis acyl carrier protein